MIDRASLTTTATIASGDTVSGAISHKEFATGGFRMPATFTGSSVTFQVSDDGSTYAALYNSSNAQISISVAASRCYPLPAELMGFRFFKIVSSNAEGGDRTIGVCFKG